MAERDDEAPPSPREQAEAARFAGLVDDLLAGASPPPAMAAEERVLLETARTIRDARPLQDGRRDAVLDAAFARRRPRRAWPWMAATLAAAAAALVLALRPPERPRLADELLSRPADGLVGRIDPAEAGDARARADLVYADRVAGYRRLMLEGGGR